MLDLAGTDTKGERAKGAVGGGVRVPADDDHARERQPLLWTDDVDDALADVVHREEGDAGGAAVFLQGLDLLGADQVGNRFVPIGGGHVVVRHGDSRQRTSRFAASELQALKRLW